MQTIEHSFMRRAIALSLQSVHSRRGGPFGAVVAKHGVIVGEGMNEVTSTNDPTAHAEIVAIRMASATLRTFLLNDCEIFCSSEPCPMCLSAIYWARIGHIYYANTRQDAAAINFDDDFLYKELTIPVSARKVQMTRLLPEEALPAFTAWNALSDKIRY